MTIATDGGKARHSSRTIPHKNSQENITNKDHIGKNN